MLSATKTKIMAAGALAVALLLVPAPLIPPDWMAQAVQSAVGASWKAAYLVSAVGLQALLYTTLGVLAALTLNRAATLQHRLLQGVIAPLIIVGLAFILRTIKLGHLPALANAAVPAAACLLGVGLGLGLLYRRMKIALPVATAVIALALWALLGSVSSSLTRCTEASLHSIVLAGREIPPANERFGAFAQAAFTVTDRPTSVSAIEQNRGAILALGIALGHERLCRCAGLDQRSELVRAAVALRQGTALRGREDWARHYTLSAALAVWQHPLISDAGGLIKEQLDALTHGSGFSFGDLAADRAGVKFAEAATRSETDAQVIRGRLQKGFVENDFFPRIDDLPENLTVEQFRSRYGGVGGPRYREQLEVIEQRLNQCAALAVQH